MTGTEDVPGSATDSARASAGAARVDGARHGGACGRSASLTRRRWFAAALIVAQLAGAGCAARREHLLRPDSAPEYISRLNARYGGQPASVLLDDGSLVAGNWLWVETDSILLSSESGAGPLGFSPERVRGLRVRDRAAGARAGLRAGALAGSLLGLPLGWALSGYNLSGRSDDPTVWERAGGALLGATILGALFGVPAMLAGGAAGGEVWIHPRGYGAAAADSAAGRERLDRWPGFPGGR